MAATEPVLRKSEAQSKRAAPLHGLLLLVSSASLWGLERFVAIPTWFVALVLGLIAFTLAGDLINLCYCRWRLRRLRLHKGQHR